MSAASGSGELPEDPTIVGREVLAAIGPAVADITVQLARVSLSTALSEMRYEAHDKRIVQLRVDRRDSSVAPIVVSVESGAARQLIAALEAAADSAEDLISVSG